MAIGSLIGAIIFVGSFVAAAETLGLDKYFPVTKSELIQHVGAQSRTNEQNDRFWEREFRAEQRGILREYQQWKNENPNGDNLMRELFEQQIEDLDQTIQGLEQQ